MNSFHTLSANMNSKVLGFGPSRYTNWPDGMILFTDSKYNEILNLLKKPNWKLRVFLLW
jgi:hypothetical protein